MQPRRHASKRPGVELRHSICSRCACRSLLLTPLTPLADVCLSSEPHTRRDRRILLGSGEVLAVEESGNQTITEFGFTTGK